MLKYFFWFLLNSHYFWSFSYFFIQPTFYLLQEHGTVENYEILCEFSWNFSGQIKKIPISLIAFRQSKYFTKIWKLSKQPVSMVPDSFKVLGKKTFFNTPARQLDYFKTISKLAVSLEVSGQVWKLLTSASQWGNKCL